MEFNCLCNNVGLVRLCYAVIMMYVGIHQCLFMEFSWRGRELARGNEMEGSFL